MTESKPADFPWPVRIKMLVLNLLPLAHGLLLAGLGRLDIPWGLRCVAVAAGLYLLPPLAVRLLNAAMGRPEGRIAVGEQAFLLWWASAQAQMLFNRLPFLDELLRLVPGLYSAWLRLWGSRIGRLTFWAPGVSVLDRGYLDIGDDVVFGTGVRLNGHVLLGKRELVLAPVKIGSGAAIGGYALFSAGVEIGAGETTRAYLLLPPFSVWRDGKREKQA